MPEFSCKHICYRKVLVCCNVRSSACLLQRPSALIDKPEPRYDCTRPKNRARRDNRIGADTSTVADNCTELPHSRLDAAFTEKNGDGPLRILVPVVGDDRASLQVDS